MPLVSDDVANAEDEDGMRQSPRRLQAPALAEFREFSPREMGDHTREELLARFNYLDGDNSGVDMRVPPLCAPRRAEPLDIEIFDEDGSGKIDKREFRRASARL